MKIHTNEKIYFSFFDKYKIFRISAETSKNNGINTIIVNNGENKPVIWLKMHDMQDELGVKNISDLTIKEIKGIFNSRNSTKNKLKNIKDRLVMDLFTFIKHLF